MAAPLGTVLKSLSTGLKAVGKGALNTLKKAPVFDIRQSGSSIGNRVKWVDENASMNLSARLYNDGAHGARSNIITGNGQAPAITLIRKDGSNAIVRFDGVKDRLLIDRKILVVTTEKAKNRALRQSESLSQNRLRGCCEVPNQTQLNRALKMFKELKIKNIDVKVVVQ